MGRCCSDNGGSRSFVQRLTSGVRRGVLCGRGCACVWGRNQRGAAVGGAAPGCVAREPLCFATNCSLVRRVQTLQKWCEKERGRWSPPSGLNLTSVSHILPAAVCLPPFRAHSLHRQPGQRTHGHTWRTRCLNCPVCAALHSRRDAHSGAGSPAHSVQQLQASSAARCSANAGIRHWPGRGLVTTAARRSTTPPRPRLTCVLRACVTAGAAGAAGAAEAGVPLYTDRGRHTARCGQQHTCVLNWLAAPATRRGAAQQWCMPWAAVCAEDAARSCICRRMGA
jgi:hypothetical protein